MTRLDKGLDGLVREIERWRDRSRPALFGIAGGVGVGKTTLAGALADAVRRAGLTVAVFATDGFLLPNDELGARGLLTQKGFPQTYDLDLLAAALDGLRAGRSVEVPVYSHDLYDRLPDPVTVEPEDVVVVEGVNVLQPAVADRLDFSIWIEAHEHDMRTWFFERFDELCERGEGFYAAMAGLSPARRREVADRAWTEINLVNFEQHIKPTKHRARWQLQKNADHSVKALAGVAPPRARGAGPS